MHDAVPGGALFGVLVGNPYGDGNVDWLINTSALTAGQNYSFGIQAAVPELGMLGITTRRRLKA
ncbi:hypothetical protein VVD49_05110 [Uliginosibacterium sp. H3]|uniref:Uncharacterized protein n=1 Tax=Uliginosibacterium silvisoli TaxID=3114758 RepID=A0ABU6K0V7_9RHOO|nr:hypothetical protein [Uliginosibacterium sp. H3]